MNNPPAYIEFDKLFPVLITALIANDGQYYDEYQKQTYSLKRVVIVHRHNELWASTYRDDEKTFYSRPLLVMSDGRIVLRDLSYLDCKVKEMGPISWGTDGRYNRYYWYTVDYSDFLVSQFPFTLVENYSDTEGRERILVNTPYNLDEEFTGKMVLITPADPSEIVDASDINLYEQLVHITGVSSTWSSYGGYALYPEVKLQLKDNKLQYYLVRIHGDCSNDGDDKFDIVLEDRKLVPKEGEIEFLEKALKRYARNGYYNPNVLQYEKQRASYMTNHVHNWMMAGAPDVGIDYDFMIMYGKLSVSNMKKGNIKLRFVGLADEYLEVKHEVTGQSWTFTNSPGYGHVEVPGSIYLKSAANIYHPNNKPNSYGLDMNYECISEAQRLLEPFITALKSP